MWKSIRTSAHRREKTKATLAAQRERSENSLCACGDRSVRREHLSDSTATCATLTKILNKWDKSNVNAYTVNGIKIQYLQKQVDLV